MQVAYRCGGCGHRHTDKPGGTNIPCPKCEQPHYQVEDYTGPDMFLNDSVGMKYPTPTNLSSTGHLADDGMNKVEKKVEWGSVYDTTHEGQLRALYIHHRHVLAPQSMTVEDLIADVRDWQREGNQAANARFKQMSARKQAEGYSAGDDPLIKQLDEQYGARLDQLEEHMAEREAETNQRLSGLEAGIGAILQHLGAETTSGAGESETGGSERNDTEGEEAETGVGEEEG